MRKFLILAAVLMLYACARPSNYGTPFDWEAAKKVKVGMMSSEVESIMGRPYMTQSVGANQNWTYTYSIPYGMGSHTVSFLLANGVVSSVPSIPDSFKQGEGRYSAVAVPNYASAALMNAK